MNGWSEGSLSVVSWFKALDETSLELVFLFFSSNFHSLSDYFRFAFFCFGSFSLVVLCSLYVGLYFLSRFLKYLSISF